MTSALESRREVRVKVRRNLLGAYSSIGEKVLGHYEVRERIGEGGVALVYKARDTRLGRWVALKVLQPWAMGHEGFRQQLVHEAKAASALNHPNIVTVHEIVTDENGVCFIVMEYVAGETLDAVIPPRGFPVRKALYYAFQIVEALRAAEAVGIVHGDLKPQNVMVTAQGQVKLLDFGLARALAGEPASRARLLAAQFGTKAYMAPERLAGPRKDPNPRSDIFSFGLILHSLLSGRHPFLSRRGNRSSSTRSEKSITLPSRVPASLGRVVRRCLLKNPRQRLASMRDLFDALSKCDSRRPQIGHHQKRAVSPTRSKLTAHRLRDLQVRRTLQRIGYHNLTGSRQSLIELKRMLDGSPSSDAREAVTTALADLIHKGVDFGGEVSMAVREFRKFILEVLMQAADGRLSSCFANGQLEHLDLYGMDFSGAHLVEISFRGAFLVGASFGRSDLTKASFAGAWIRNANFERATLSDADLTDADWFNAVGLTEAQLRSARHDTLLQCPDSDRMLHRYLQARYGFPFESWPRRHQRELEAAWRGYLRPGGLRDLLKASPQKSG